MRAEISAPKMSGFAKKLKMVKADRVLYLMIGLVLIYFVLFRVWPIYNMRLAFYKYKAIGPWEWVGLKYFIAVFKSGPFMDILKNTLIISFMKFILLFPFSVIFAIFLNEIRSRITMKYIQVVSYLPRKYFKP